MNYIKKIKLIYTDPKEFLNRLKRYLRWILLDKLFFLFAFFLFTFFPRYIYLLLGKPIVNNKNRWKKRDAEDEWIFDEKTEEVFDEINIVCRGISLEKYSKKINRKIITFFVNFNNETYNNKFDIKDIPYIGITADFGVKRDILRSGIAPVIFLPGGSKSNEEIKWDEIKTISNENLNVDEEILKKINLIKAKKIFHFKQTEEKFRFWLGSAVLAIFYLGKHSKKVNIYGWDHYLDEEVHKLSYLKSLYNMATKAPSGPWGKKFRFVFAEAIWNWHYASRILENKKYNLFSNLSNIKKQNYILEKIDKIFFIR